MKTSLGFYEIVYNQGTKQVKELIGRDDYEVYKTLSDKKNDITSKMKGSKKKERDPELMKELSEVTKELKNFSFPFFVVGSPIYDAIETGILSLPESQGGDTHITVTKIDKPVSVSNSSEEDED